MARQMSTEERERMYQLFTTHPVSRARSEKIRAESLAKGKIEGKIEGKQEVICKFLARRFGLDSAEIQEKVRRLTDLIIKRRSKAAPSALVAVACGAKVSASRR